jgi:hypothetical protein
MPLDIFPRAHGTILKAVIARGNDITIKVICIPGRVVHDSVEVLCHFPVTWSEGEKGKRSLNDLANSKNPGIITNSSYNKSVLLTFVNTSVSTSKPSTRAIEDALMKGLASSKRSHAS